VDRYTPPSADPANRVWSCPKVGEMAMDWDEKASKGDLGGSQVLPPSRDRNTPALVAAKAR